MFLQNIRVAWKIVKSKSQDPIPIPEVPTKDIKEGLDWGMNKIASLSSISVISLCVAAGIPWEVLCNLQTTFWPVRLVILSAWVPYCEIIPKWRVCSSRILGCGWCPISKGPHILNPSDIKRNVFLKRFEAPGINSIALISLGNES